MTNCLPGFELVEVQLGNPESPLQMKQCLMDSPWGRIRSYFTRTTSDYYEQLYSLDVLGVEDRKECDQKQEV